VPSVPPRSDSPPALEEALLALLALDELDALLDAVLLEDEPPPSPPLEDVLLEDAPPPLLDELLALLDEALLEDEPPLSPLLLDDVALLAEALPPVAESVRLCPPHDVTAAPSNMQMPNASERGLATECLFLSMERLPGQNLMM
jgi:hypothetical protein